MRRIVISLAAAYWTCSCSLAPAGAWSAAALPPSAIQPFSLVLPLGGEKAGVFGGDNLQTGQPIARTLIYDGATDRWSLGADIPQARFGESAAIMPDGEVLVAGGFGPSSAGLAPVLSSTYLYDPRRDSWQRSGDLPVAKADAEATLLSDGRVLLVGGSVPLPRPAQLPNGAITDVQSSGSVEIFDPRTGMWSEVAALPELRTGEILAALPHGDAIAAGGCVSSNGRLDSTRAVDTVDLFDSGPGTWTEGPKLPEGRCGGSGMALADGRVLVMGGFTQTGDPITTALLFDPAAGAWRDAGHVAIASNLIPLNGSGAVESASLSRGRAFVPIAQAGKQAGRLSTVVVGGQLYDPSSAGWSFATSTEAQTSTRFGSPTVMGVAPLGPDRVLILLENAALIFNADASPPQGAYLESESVTLLLAALAGALVLAIAATYFLARPAAR